MGRKDEGREGSPGTWVTGGSKGRPGGQHLKEPPGRAFWPLLETWPSAETRRTNTTKQMRGISQQTYSELEWGADRVTLVKTLLPVKVENLKLTLG